MSSILKALKKLEEERTSAVGRPGPAGRSDTDHPQAGRRYKGLFLLCCGVLIGILTVGGGLMMVTGLRDVEDRPAGGAGIETSADARGISRAELHPEAARSGASGGMPAVDQPSTPVEALSENAAPKTTGGAAQQRSGIRAVATTTGSPPGSPATGSATAVAAEGRSATAGGAAQPIPVPAASLQSIPATTAATARPPVAPPPEPVEEVRVPAVDAVAVVPAAAVKTVPSSPPPLFRVSEIYYQPEGGSMAVVDDLPVMEGTILNGALVEQILADRVRLIVDGLAVEIPLVEFP